MIARILTHLPPLACLLLLSVNLGAAPPAMPSDEPPAPPAQAAAPAPQSDDPGCIRCHTCAHPTPENRCLPLCTRRAALLGAAGAAENAGPDVIVLNELEDAYLPVPFDHRGHARMAQMGDGCVACHHYTPAGAAHPPCKSCHAIADTQAGIDKPGLRGAYHQQCLNCHREWINEKDCTICHREKAERSAAADAAATPSKDDILSLMHPPIPEPETDIYSSGAASLTGTQVIFRHRVHTGRYGLRCVECHHERSCARCHAATQEPPPPRTLSAHHRSCIRCHKREMDLVGREAGRCGLCHWREGQPEPKPFDHADTGWPLRTFHQDLSCRTCHPGVPFTGLDGECTACHSDWSPSTFDHRLTGQLLDENHAEQDCEVCHPQRRFSAPPTCDNCHDEDEGVSFPAKRPGPRAAEPGAGAVPASDTPS